MCYEDYRKEFVGVCHEFDVHYTEDMIQEAFEDEVEPYDYLYELYGEELENNG